MDVHQLVRLELERSVARAKADYAKGHFVKESAKIHFKRLGI
jgi:hypothetical protein